VLQITTNSYPIGFSTKGTEFEDYESQKFSVDKLDNNIDYEKLIEVIEGHYSAEIDIEDYSKINSIDILGEIYMNGTTHTESVHLEVHHTRCREWVPEVLKHSSLQGSPYITTNETSQYKLDTDDTFNEVKDFIEDYVETGFVFNNELENPL